ncbi:MAG: hypothetical protein H7235_06985 [Bdellovibrionaceae bacterium]|nr:hypothetical protein [Pseudobdellovibrionaceae bacterium]
MKNSVVLAFLLLIGAQAFAKTCLYVNSYHSGYPWSDGIESSLEAGLKGKCTLIKFNMDTKKSPTTAKQKGEEAKALIESKKPDVVIVSDDNAVKYLLMPFFKDSKVPFVYLGVNWSGDAYGLPYKNTTGMIEVAPVQAVLQEVKAASGSIKKAIFLSPDNESEQMDAKFTQKLFKAGGIEMDIVLVKNMNEWKEAYKKAQESTDLVYVNNNAGINDWNEAEGKATAAASMKKVTTGIYEWMAPYSTFVMMKQPEEQGEFGAQAAIQILAGKAPDSIPVERNKRATPMLNSTLAGKSPYKLSENLMNKAKKIN